MSQTKFKLDSNQSIKNLICQICKKLLIDAYQTYCGCQYCRSCLVDYLANVPKFCAGDKEECKDERLELDKNVLKNVMLDRKILKLNVSCPNEGCTYRSNALKMEEHYCTCTRQLLECPYLSIGCNKDTTNEMLLTHLENEILPHTKLFIDLIKKLENQFSTLQTTYDESKRLLLEESRMNKMRFEELEKEIEYLKRESENKDNRITTIEEQSKTKDITIMVLQEKLQSIENADYQTERKLEQLDSKLRKMSTIDIGETVVIVDNFEYRKTCREIVYSRPFYSHINGYKLRIQIHPGGFGLGIGTHLSVFIVICNGKYDNILQWPCKCIFSLSISNQYNVSIFEGVTFDYGSTQNSERFVFDKPISRYNKGYGFQKFISNNELREITNNIADDAVNIRCVVTLP